MKYCITERLLFEYVNHNIIYLPENIILLIIEDINDFNHFSPLDEILFVIGNNHKLEISINMCHRIGIKNIQVMELYSIEKRERFVDDKGRFLLCIKKVSLDKAYLVHIETHICDYCNLNCKACNNFSPWVQKKETISIDFLKKDLNVIKKSFNIGRLFLLGGEPFLETELVIESIEVCRNIFPETEIRLLSNGLLIPKLKTDVLMRLSRNDIILYITLYPPTLNILDDIKSVLFQNNIKFVLGSKVDTFDKRWTDKPYEDAEYNSMNCGSSGCHYFGRGYFSKCPDAATIHYTGNEIAQIAQNSIGLLNEITDPWRTCYELERPSDMCRYCAIDRVERIPWSTTGKKTDINDWVIDNRNTWIKKMKLKFNQFLKENGFENSEIFIWGTGGYFKRMYSKIKEYIPIKYLFDSNQTKLENVSDQLGVASLKENIMSQSKDLLCIVVVERPDALTEIYECLSKNNIEYIHINEWLKHI